MDAMRSYLANKPKGAFGEHVYEPGPPEAIAAERAKFRRYQDYFDVPDEV
jgi:hypothetical protein